MGKEFGEQGIRQSKGNGYRIMDEEKWGKRPRENGRKSVKVKGR